MFRAAFGNVDCMEVLIAAKASVDQKNLEGCTPTCFAAARGQIECLKLLLGTKADVDNNASNKMDGLRYMLRHTMDKQSA